MNALKVFVFFFVMNCSSGYGLLKTIHNTNLHINNIIPHDIFFSHFNLCPS